MNRRALVAFLTVMAGVFFAGCTNTPNTPGGTVTSANFTFYVTGLESGNVRPSSSADEGPSFYAIAGVVTIDSNGNVTGGEQDYNDGFGLTSPQPSGDKITSGSLTQTAGTQQGTLTLITNNSTLGVNGTETFALQVVNDNHGLITHYDATATSSGSFDLQTLPGTPSGNYAFTLSGYYLTGKEFYDSIATGGIFSVSGTRVQNGIVDVNDDGFTALNTAFTASISAPDSLGRGTVSTISDVSIGTRVNYYVVNSKVIRLIVVDPTDSPVGSAFSQGTGTFSNSSIGSSVFSAISNSWGDIPYSVAGMLTPGSVMGARPVSLQRRPEGAAGSATFNGVADVNEGGTFSTAVIIFGNYGIASNGYGALSVTSENLQDVVTFGLYATDPNLNLYDPNNTTSGTGGALLAEMDSLVGAGILTPQSDTAVGSFTGAYAFGGQVFNGGENGWEVDFLGQGSVTSLAFGSATGFLNDPFATLSATLKSAVTFSGTADADALNPGRYTVAGGTSLTIAYNGQSIPFATTIYQASGKYLAWMETDDASLFGGSLEQLTSATPDDKPAEHLLRIIHR